MLFLVSLVFFFCISEWFFQSGSGSKPVRYLFSAWNLPDRLCRRLGSTAVARDVGVLTHVTRGNLPNNYTRAMVCTMMDKEGFKACSRNPWDFPRIFAKKEAMGHLSAILFFKWCVCVRAFFPFEHIIMIIIDEMTLIPQFRDQEDCCCLNVKPSIKWHFEPSFLAMLF